MLKNIVFDMGNVLLDYDPKRYVGSLGFTEAAASSVLGELFRGPEWRLIDAGQCTEDEAVAAAIARAPEYAEAIRQAMRDWDSHMTPIFGTWKLVDRLKAAGYKLYVLSNASPRFPQYCTRYRIFDQFDGILISALEKLIKPETAIYHRLEANFGLTGGECLFIDDLAENVEGAVKAGWQGHQFLGPEELEAFFVSERIL